MSSSIFREYDIRGIFQKELNEDIVKKIGFYLAKALLKRVPNASFLAVGYDARLHSPTLKGWLSSGINKAGLKVLDMGLVPTPANYFANFNEIDGYRCDGSIMITGSHNPPEYNGFKITLNKEPFFGEDIYLVATADIKNIGLVFILHNPSNHLRATIFTKEHSTKKTWYASTIHISK